MAVKNILKIFCFILSIDFKEGFAEGLSQEKSHLQSELHWSLCGHSSKEIIRKLGLEVERKEERSISFYDFKNLDESFHFFSKGIVLRFRESSDGRDQSTIKIRFKSAQDFYEQEHLLKEEKYKCEEDRYKSKVSYFCSLTRELEQGEQEVFSENQKSFLKTVYSGDLNMKKMSVFGPAENSVWIFSRSKGFVLEEVRLPDSTSFYELSLKVPLEEAELRFQENLSLLQKKNIHLCESQESKTLKLLNFFDHLKILKE